MICSKTNYWHTGSLSHVFHETRSQVYLLIMPLIVMRHGHKISTNKCSLRNVTQACSLLPQGVDKHLQYSI